MPRATKKEGTSSRVFLFVCIVCNSDRVQMKKRLYKQVDRKKRVADRSDAVIHRERENMYTDLMCGFLFIWKKIFAACSQKGRTAAKGLPPCGGGQLNQYYIDISIMYRVKQGTVCVCVCVHHNTLCVVLTARRRRRRRRMKRTKEPTTVRAITLRDSHMCKRGMNAAAYCQLCILECSAPSIHPSIPVEKKKKKHLKYKRGEMLNVSQHRRSYTSAHTHTVYGTGCSSTSSLFYKVYTHADFWALLFLSAPAKSWKSRNTQNRKRRRATYNQCSSLSLLNRLPVPLNLLYSLAYIYTMAKEGRKKIKGKQSKKTQKKRWKERARPDIMTGIRTHISRSFVMGRGRFIRQY